MHINHARRSHREVKLSVCVGYLLNKRSRACCGPTRNLQCAMVEKRENSLWLFNQPVVALGVVCLCSTASNKWISHWQTDVGKKEKKDSAYKSFSFPFQTSARTETIQNTQSGFSPSDCLRCISAPDYRMAQTLTHYCYCTVDTLSLCEHYIVCCMLMAYWPCMV